MKHIITTISALAACLTPALAQTPVAMTATAQKIIAERMIDPTSLQLRNTKVITATSPLGKPVQALCGEYNAKNRLGGYTGFTSFIYEPAEMGGVLSIDLPRKRMDFYSSDGKTDLSGDPRDAFEAGLSSDEINRRNQKNVTYGVKYLRLCMA